MAAFRRLPHSIGSRPSAMRSALVAAKFLIGAIDQGTTSTRFVLYDQDAKPVASHQLEIQQIHPQASWVEHDPADILRSVRQCMRRAVEEASEAGSRVAVKALGITNQRETTIVWSRTDGKPLHNAIVWMDARTSDLCRQLEADLEGGRDHFKQTTGLPISNYFSALKLRWLLDNVPAVKAAAERGDALFGTVDSWLVWNLTGGCGQIPGPDREVGQGPPALGHRGRHVTDCSNAARTMLMDLHTQEWHQPTLDALKIPRAMLPTIVSNSEVLGEVAEGWPLAGTPIAGCLGDQHAAMLGQRCQKGEAKSTYGTGCFILLNTGTRVCSSAHGLLSTVAFKLGPQAQTQFALEGSIAIAGAAVQWLRDSLGIIKSAAEVEGLANQVADTGGLYFVPAFSGLFAPRWRDDARGVCVGITRYTSKAHIARAVLESIAFQAREVLHAMHKDMEDNELNEGSEDFVLRVDGGATPNNLLLQLQADLLGAPVLRPANIETTALGAALAAGLAVGVWDEKAIFNDKCLAEHAKFVPNIGAEEREMRFACWCRAVERSFDLADDP